MKSEEELKQQAKEIRMLELRKESGEIVDRAIGKSEGFFLLLIV